MTFIPEWVSPRVRFVLLLFYSHDKIDWHNRKVMLHGAICNGDSKSYNVVTILWQFETVVQQFCNALLRWKSSLRIVPCNITFRRSRSCSFRSRSVTHAPLPQTRRGAIFNWEWISLSVYMKSEWNFIPEREFYLDWKSEWTHSGMTLYRYQFM